MNLEYVIDGDVRVFYAFWLKAKKKKRGSILCVELIESSILLKKFSGPILFFSCPPRLINKQGASPVSLRGLTSYITFSFGNFLFIVKMMNSRWLYIHPFCYYYEDAQTVGDGGKSRNEPNNKRITQLFSSQKVTFFPLYGRIDTSFWLRKERKRGIVSIKISFLKKRSCH